MRRFIKNIVWVCLVALMMPSCASYKPTASSISNADYNQRIEINNPRYKKKHNAIGFTFDIGAPIAGAVAGYSLDPFVTQTDKGRKGVPVAGAALGALVGTGLTYASHAIGKYGSSTSAKDKRAWVNKAFGSNYYILEASDSRLRIINNSAEKNYTVKNINDVKDFANAFPVSLYYEQVVGQAIEKLKRDELPEVLKLFSQTTQAQKLKDRYINESPTYQELTNALNLYPKTALDVEKLFVNLVRTTTDAYDFHQRYPNSSNNKKVIINAFQTESKPEDVRRLKNAYGQDFYLTTSDLSNKNDNIRRNYYIGVRDMTNYTSMNQLDSFNEKYSWLTFNDKKREIALKAWATADHLYSNGKDVIAQAGRIVGTSYANKAGLDYNFFNQFANDLLKQQFNKMKVVSTQTLSSTSEEFERWKRSIYSAGVVKTDGKLQYLVYGEVKNESKFDFPVVLRVHSKVCQVQKIEGGLLGGFIKVLGALTQTPTENVQLLGTLNSKEFIIPCAISKQTIPYAILIEFEDKVFNGHSAGLNLADLMKVSSQIILQDVNVNVEMADHDASDEQLTEQNAWLQMAINGLPEAKTIDWLRNKEYKQATWDAEWAEILRNSKNHSYSSSSSSKSEDKDVDVESVTISDFTYTIDDDWGSSIGNLVMSVERKDVYFKDSEGKYEGSIYRKYGKSDSDIKNLWFGRGMDEFSYDSWDNLIIALYCYEKYGKTRKTGRKTYIWD